MLGPTQRVSVSERVTFSVKNQTMFGFCRNCLKSDCLKSLVFVTRFFEKDQTLVKNIESLFKFGSVEATA